MHWNGLASYAETVLFWRDRRVKPAEMERHALICGRHVSVHPPGARTVTDYA